MFFPLVRDSIGKTLNIILCIAFICYKVPANNTSANSGIRRLRFYIQARWQNRNPPASLPPYKSTSNSLQTTMPPWVSQNAEVRLRHPFEPQNWEQQHTKCERSGFTFTSFPTLLPSWHRAAHSGFPRIHGFYRGRTELEVNTHLLTILGRITEGILLSCPKGNIGGISRARPPGIRQKQRTGFFVSHQPAQGSWQLLCILASGGTLPEKLANSSTVWEAWSPRLGSLASFHLQSHGSPWNFPSLWGRSRLAIICKGSIWPCLVQAAEFWPCQVLDMLINPFSNWKSEAGQWLTAEGVSGSTQAQRPSGWSSNSWWSA